MRPHKLLRPHECTRFPTRRQKGRSWGRTHAHFAKLQHGRRNADNVAAYFFAWKVSELIRSGLRGTTSLYGWKRGREPREREKTEAERYDSATHPPFRILYTRDCPELFDGTEPSFIRSGGIARRSGLNSFDRAEIARFALRATVNYRANFVERRAANLP
jgi:hypothetical protein